MKNKIISLILAIIMCLPMLVACSSPADGAANGESKTAQDGGDTDDGDAAETEPEKVVYSANIPADVKYGGYEFRIVTNLADGTIWGDVDWNVEETNGEVLNDAVYERSRKVEELLDVKIVPLESSGGTDSLKNSILAAEDAYDAGWIGIQGAFNLASAKNLIELNSIDTLQLDQPWWDQNSVADLSIGHKNYMVTGDIGTMYKKSIGVIMFNKQILEDYSLQSPYELLPTNDWTIDNMVEMATKTSLDLNGDGMFDKEDQFGLIFFCDMMGLAFIGSGVKFVTKNEQDIPEITFYGDKTVSILEKLATILYNPELSWSWSKAGVGELPAFDMFQNNQSLFYYGELHAVATMRTMDADFGILPMPLYDNTQESYYHCINPFAAMSLCVPMTNTDLNRTGYILDALGAESKNILTPAYYDVTLKGKVSRDAQSADSLDIVLSTVRYDLGYIATWSMTSLPLSLADSYDLNLSSKWAKLEKVVQKAMEKSIKTFIE